MQVYQLSKSNLDRVLIMEYVREKYSFSISCIRVIATLLIILCHIVQEYDNTMLVMIGQIFNVGVIIFFFIYW